jgi:hypothetical protein
VKPTAFAAFLAGMLAAPSLGAQGVAQRVVASDGLVEVVYPSRPSACGDGQSFIGNILGRHRMFVDDGGYSGRSRWETQPCVRGPGRALVTVIAGEVTRIRTFVGPAPASRTDVRTITATAPEAASWLGDLVERGPSRVASQAVLPLVIAAGPEPWPLLIKVARSGNRPREVSRSALQWLSSGVTEHLGLDSDDSRESDEDQMREQAVFVLSQRPKSESVPELIDLAKNGRHPAARKAAIFWLSQSGDSRVVDVYAELLGLKP